ncbi:CPBP family intramembrane glutamic endopeptidase [Desulfosarcina sp.]|uniref:CPBP family intramembrane glutamic endopeptidase n=1 Tax=Desulfosarcina sp. TaxID=2027861 RepID=UPI0039705BA1
MPAALETNAVQLLPADRTLNDLLWPYVTPYLIFVGIASLPETILPVEMGQALKLAATAAALLFFGKTYRFGAFKPIHAAIALLGLPVALFCWIAPFYLIAALGITDVMAAAGGKTVASFPFFLRLFNSVVLVAIFEELFVRVYVMGWLYQAGPQCQEKGLLGSIVHTLDEYPGPLAALPLSTFSVVGATLVFTAGHRAHEYLSAIVYFLFTTWLYKKSGSLWVCIIIHGLTNLAIALLARYGGMGWLFS